MTSPWYAAEVEAYREFQQNNVCTGMAEEWGYKAGDVQHCLAHALAAARNFARMVGVPACTEITLAHATHVGTACAGFHDGPFGFRKPWILINTGALFRDNQMSPSEPIEMAIGLALHEASHITSSRAIYRRLALPDRDPRRVALENLLEDYRIENIVLRESPHLARYIYLVREQLLINDFVKSATLRWNDVPYEQKVLAIMGCYIRTPILFSELPVLREFEDAGGRNLFLRLCRRLLPDPPVTEEDVMLQASRLMMELPPRPKPKAFSDEELLNRRLIDQLDHPQIGLARRLVAVSSSPIMSSGGLELNSHADRIISELTFEEMVDAQDRVRVGADPKLLSKVSLLEQHMQPARQQDPLLQVSQRITHSHLASMIPGGWELRCATPTASSLAAYNTARDAVRSQIARLANIFPSQPVASRQRHGLSAGQLSRKRLAAVQFSERIFMQRQPRAYPPRTQLVMLLDASASMFENGRYQRVLETAALLNEAFSQHSQIDLVTYSHQTTRDHRCLLIPHGRANDPQTRAKIGAYEPSGQNIDATAILLLTLGIHRNEAFAQRYLIVVSDGKPWASQLAGFSGPDETCDAVNQARRAGWKVIGIGIDDQHVRYIYDDRWAVTLSSCQLPNNMASLLAKLVSQ